MLRIAAVGSGHHECGTIAFAENVKGLSARIEITTRVRSLHYQRPAVLGVADIDTPIVVIIGR
ncbi:MAG: hypothetical protein AAFO03_23975 [Bacteroidota bacterium]